MAAPQVTEVVQKNPTQILVYFDSPIDEDIAFPQTSFSINYGKIPILSAGYYGTAAVLLVLDRELTYRDKIELNYEPSDDVDFAIRAPVGEDANQLVIRRNVVRAFYKVPVKNLIKPDETFWDQDSNLGGGKYYNIDPDDPDSSGGWDGVQIGCDPVVTTTTDPTTGVVTTNTIAGPDEPYPNDNRPGPRSATPDDFILAYGLREAIQLSNIDDADAIEPNNQKIWMAIQDACALIDNYITMAGRAGKLLISSSRRRTSLIIARYYLDTVRRREDVKTDYQDCIKELQANINADDVVRPDEPSWLDPCNPNSGNLIRSHRIPQYYNGVNGRGLDGWWVDPGYDYKHDQRTSGENSQNNNNGNGGGYTGSREPHQPTDAGGSDPGGGTT